MEHYGVSDALFLLEGKIANQTPSVGGINMDTMLAWPHLSVFAAALKIYQCSERTPSTASKTLEHDAFSLLSLLLYSCRGDPCTFSALNLVKTASIVASVLRERLCLLATLSLTQIYADSYALVLIFRIANVELLISSSQLFLLSLHKLKLLSAIIGISFLIVLFAELFGFHSECSSRGAPEERTPSIKLRRESKYRVCQRMSDGPEWVPVGQGSTYNRVVRTPVFLFPRHARTGAVRRYSRASLNSGAWPLSGLAVQLFIILVEEIEVGVEVDLLMEVEEEEKGYKRRRGVGGGKCVSKSRLEFGGRRSLSMPSADLPVGPLGNGRGKDQQRLLRKVPAES
ncbi:hypothetical protein Tco_0247563 [Tanacetum coccineum]